MAKKETAQRKTRKSLRTHKHIFCLNDEEQRALDRYIHKYKVENRSKLIRESLMITIIRKLEEDQPTLFG